MKKALILAALLALALGVVLALGPLDAEQLRAWVAQAAAWRAAHPLALALGLLGAYALATGLSLPLAVPFTLACGALFGFWQGLVIASFASSLGATAAMLLARTLMRDWARARLGSMAGRVERLVARDGAMALFSLRLVPVVPFFAVNLAFGLTAMPAVRFYAVSQIGMLPGAMAYTYAGTQLAQIGSFADLVSPGLLAAFVALGLLPWAARGALALIAARKRAQRWPRPKRFEADLVVIGGGAAGLVAAYVAAKARAKVVLVAEGPMGGDCLNFGCVPSKALIASGKAAAGARGAERLGVSAQVRVDFPAVMAHLQATIAAIEPKDSEARYRSLGVEVLRGRARLETPYQVAVEERRIATRAVVLATGAAPVLPDVPGLAEVALTTETLWDWLAVQPHAPRDLVVLGGGPVGCELAQALARLGGGVVLIEAGARLLPREEPEAAALVQAALEADGVRVICGATLTRVAEGQAHLSAGEALVCGRVLVAVGRRLRAEGLGLEQLGIAADRVIETDAFLRTAQPNIFVAGDAAGPMQLTSAAGHQGWVVAANALAAPLWRFRAEAPIPAAIFTEPEVARVGLSCAEVQAQGLAYEITRFELAELDRAVAEGRPEGFVQVIAARGTGRILGATVVGAQASAVLDQFSLAMRHGLSLSKLLATPQIYPGWGEAARATAGKWRSQRVSPRLTRLAERYFAWRRG